MKVPNTIFSTITIALLVVSAGSAFSQAPAAAATATPAAPVPRDPQLSIFGIGNSAANSGNHPKWMPLMVAIGIRDCRSGSGGWGTEMEEGVFDFTKFDSRIGYDESIGVQDGVLLYGWPPWKKPPEKGLAMSSLPEWTTMVREVAKHSKGRIKLFEVWNEPPNSTTKEQTGADYAKLVCATYDGAKAGNPDAMVGMAAKSAHLTYLDQALRNGAKGHFDYITLHPYEILGCVLNNPGTEPMFLSIVPNVRKMLAKRDPAKVNAPVIFTEIGYDSRRGLDKQAQAVLKTYIMGIHSGVACINWFEGMDGDSGPLGLLDGKCNPRPAYTSLGKLIEVVGRHPTSIGWVLLNDKHYGFMIQGPKGPVLGTWAATSKPDMVNFGQTVNIIDPIAGTTTEAATCNLSMSPVLITNVPASLVAQAKANMNKPIPWGGDYSKAKSVSVTFADKYEEKGLHTLAGTSIAADVLAYGGSARSGELPKGGNVFYIDPNFLSYDTVPIEITARVKLKDPAHKAGLSVEYESEKTVREGYARTPNLQIPEDTSQWHDVSWKIDDSQFVGTWAFHFRLSGDPKNYLIQSLTVKRLDRS